MKNLRSHSSVDRFSFHLCIRIDRELIDKAPYLENVVEHDDGLVLVLGLLPLVQLSQPLNLGRPIAQDLTIEGEIPVCVSTVESAILPLWSENQRDACPFCKRKLLKTLSHIPKVYNTERPIEYIRSFSRESIMQNEMVIFLRSLPFHFPVKIIDWPSGLSLSRPSGLITSSNSLN